MIKAILLLIGCILCILGLTEFLHGLWLLFTAPPHRRKIYTVVWLDEKHCENQLHFAAAQQAWFGNDFAEAVIAVYSDLSGEKTETCRQIAEASGMLFCPADALSELLVSVAEK